jgi:hypothetical protein
MNPINILLVLIFGLLLANAANAESPREQLKQMVEQLQQTPNDNALREKIIKLAPTLKPPPALPDAAITFEGRAQFAFKSAKSEDDFLAAAREYEKAVAAAPWVQGYYTDLCTIYEKAGKFEDAKRHCGFYLIGLTDPAQMTDVKRRIAGLEFGIEKATAANTPQAREAALMKSLEGAVFSHSFSKVEEQFRISKGRATFWSRRIASGGALCRSGGSMNGPIGEQMTCHSSWSFPLVGRRGVRSDYWGLWSVEIAEDGEKLTLRAPNIPEQDGFYDTVYMRQ